MRRTNISRYVVLALILAAASLSAHDIPNDVTVQTFVKPEGERLRVILRVPLAAMRDIDYPKRPDGLLDLSRADRALHDAATLWVGDNLIVYEADRRLDYPRVVDVRASLAADASFASYESALAHVTGRRLPDNTEFVWNQGWLDMLFEYPIQSDHSRFSVDPRFARLGIRVVTVLRFLPPGGAVRAFEYAGDPGLVRLDPRWHQAALRFVQLGFAHILDGIDHLLFLFCLVIPFRRFRPLFVVVTSFTVAHSITLIASAYDLGPTALWFPALIETLIAASIVYMALENIVFSARSSRPSVLPNRIESELPTGLEPRRHDEGADSGETCRGDEEVIAGGMIGRRALERRWIITFAFGLVHGFGFSFALRQTLQFGGSHLLTSLLSFNIGVELGQILVLAVLVPALSLLFRYVVAERIGTIILSALIAHTGWHWMTERFQTLHRFTFTWPELNTFFWLTAVRWLMLLVALAAIAWMVAAVRRRSRVVREKSGRQGPSLPSRSPVALDAGVTSNRSPVAQGFSPAPTTEHETS